MNLRDINKLQLDIMRFVDSWVRTEKTPVPRKEIIENMKAKGVKDFTTINAIKALLKKRYIRRAIIISNKTFYVQLRGI